VVVASYSTQGVSGNAAAWNGAGSAETIALPAVRGAGLGLGGGLNQFTAMGVATRPPRPRRARAQGIEVSWQVTGVREDAWARANSMRFEQEEVGPEKGACVTPEAHGQPGARSIYAAEVTEAKASEAAKKDAAPAQRVDSLRLRA
jgi:hypothetical protein